MRLAVFTFTSGTCPSINVSNYQFNSHLWINFKIAITSHTIEFKKKVLVFKELIERAVNYMKYLETAIGDGLSLDNTILMDETAVYLVDPRRITVNESRRRYVTLKTTGFSSMNCNWKETSTRHYCK